jgi:hypothetical protein
MSEQTPVGTQRIVIVIGPGRSGTSSVAGALQKLGLTVPGRAIPGNETNPSGFFEPRWVVDLHRELLEHAVVQTLDTSPAALERAAKSAARPQVRDRVARWLTERLEKDDQLILKDPRTVWFRDMWVETARDLGVEPGFVTMLRHPAEVSASRQKYYSGSKPRGERTDDVLRIGGWVNVALTAELVTQGSPREFVRYTDLIRDWRSVLRKVGRDLDLRFEPDLDVTPHPVDDFIDPTLHRIQVDWSDLEIPAALRDVGERVWEALTALADGTTGEDVATLRAEYAQLEADALALAKHSLQRARADGRKQGRRRANQQHARASEDAGGQEEAATGSEGRAGGLWDRIRSAGR